MKRKTLNYVPEWAGTFEKTAHALAWRDRWKLWPEYDHDDIYQEAFLCFWKCRDRYTLKKAKKKVTTAAHFMALFLTTYNRRVVWLSKLRTRHGAARLYNRKGQKRAVKARPRELDFEIDYEDADAGVQRVIDAVLGGKRPQGDLERWCNRIADTRLFLGDIPDRVLDVAGAL